MTASSDGADLPVWIIEGMRLMEEHELLQARARAAWRRHCAREAQKWSMTAQLTASQVSCFKRRIREMRNSAEIYSKTPVY